MKRLRLTTAAALASFGLLCGCATNTNTCGERQGIFSRWFGGNRPSSCDCVETGRMTVSDGPVVPDPSFGEQSFPSTAPPTFQTAPPTFQTAPPILPMPNSNGYSQPIPAGPASQVKDARK
jgi:hypothetical protein